jgi:hypothetical protein
MPSTSKHDAFISYSHLDREWVVEHLLPRLSGAGLKVYSDDQFPAGQDSVVNMTAAVEESRHTIVVLTPDWVASSWTLLEAGMAHGRLIPLLVRPCDVPQWISRLTLIDLSQPDRHETGMQKLLGQLRGELVRGEPVRQGLAALGQLLAEEEAHRAVVAFSIHFKDADRRIEVLTNYKDLHDLLHRLQHDCYEPMAQEAMKFPGDEEAGENLQAHIRDLQGLLDELSELSRRGTFIGDEPARIGRELAEATETLSLALAASDAQRLRGALGRLNHVLAVNPPKINLRLNEAARTLNLAELAATMETVCRKLRELGLRPDQVDQFEDGVRTLAGLAGTLTTLVNDHDRWQEAEQELRRIEGDLARSLEELELSWPYLKKQIEPLYLDRPESWALALREDGKKLELTLTTHDPVKARSSFRSYRRQAEKRFFRVDDTLKRQCHELRQAGEPLAVVLRMLG